MPVLALARMTGGGVGLDPCGIHLLFVYCTRHDCLWDVNFAVLRHTRTFFSVPADARLGWPFLEQGTQLSKPARPHRKCVGGCVPI